MSIEQTDNELKWQIVKDTIQKHPALIACSMDASGSYYVCRMNKELV